MPSDGLYFELFPTAGHAMIGCIVLACIVFLAQLAWCWLCDDDTPEATGSRDEVLRAIAEARLHELEETLDLRKARPR